jgi:hypothetical protein
VLRAVCLEAKEKGGVALDKVETVRLYSVAADQGTRSKAATLQLFTTHE